VTEEEIKKNGIRVMLAAIQSRIFCLLVCLLTTQLTNYLSTSSVEQSPFREAAIYAAIQNLPSILWKPRDHYRVNKSTQLVPILCQINLVHSTPSYLSKIHLKMSIHLSPGLSSGSSFRIPTINLNAFFYLPLRAT
jgi:hypothetical protein